MPVETIGARLPLPWKDFLGEIDSAVEKRLEIHCIGGFALVFYYGIPRTTGDIDYYTALPEDINLEERLVMIPTCIAGIRSISIVSESQLCRRSTRRDFPKWRVASSNGSSFSQRNETSQNYHGKSAVERLVMQSASSQDQLLPTPLCRSSAASTSSLRHSISLIRRLS